MDDPDADRDIIREALYEIAFLNRYFGAYDIFRRKLFPLISRCGAGASILDVGSGIGDCPVEIAKWADHKQISVSVTVTDINPFIVNAASEYADTNLNVSQRRMLDHKIADMHRLPFEDNSFDIVTANQVLHHFRNETIPTILREMSRVARKFIFIEDLHRHRISYLGIVAISRLLDMSSMVKHDGPVSVGKGFRRKELFHLFENAALPRPAISWHPTFRWSVTGSGDYSGA